MKKFYFIFLDATIDLSRIKKRKKISEIDLKKSGYLLKNWFDRSELVAPMK